jgi:3-phosphoshikimate 1-carboxyvinyltransferase
MRAHAAEVRPGPVSGTVRAPGSKSETHRAFLLGAQSAQPCLVRSPLLSADTQATLACLHAMGARLHLDAGGSDGDVQFLPAPLRPPREALDCRNSGTTLRLLTATAARFATGVTLTGDDSLRGRPNGGLLDALAALGVLCSSKDGKAPLTVHGPLRSGAVTLPPGTSSQFASALLLSLPFVAGPSTVDLQPPVSSAPYLDVTLQLAGAFGLRIGRLDHPGRRFHIEGGQQATAAQHTVSGDWSAAAFPLVAAAVTGGTVTVEGVRADSPQGDRAVADILRSFGAKVTVAEESVTAEGGPLRSPGTVDVRATPDLFPALCVLAACSAGTTTFAGGAALRAKESDRIAAMADGLRRMGIACAERPDGLIVTGGRPKGASLASLGDHRIHMAFAVAGLAAEGTTTIDDPACADVSYPGFHDAMQSLGAKVALLQGNRAVLP